MGSWDIVPLVPETLHLARVECIKGIRGGGMVAYLSTTWGSLIGHGIALWLIPLEGQTRALFRRYALEVRSNIQQGDQVVVFAMSSHISLIATGHWRFIRRLKWGSLGVSLVGSAVFVAGSLGGWIEGLLGHYL